MSFTSLSRITTLYSFFISKYGDIAIDLDDEKILFDIDFNFSTFSTINTFLPLVPSFGLQTIFLYFFNNTSFFIHFQNI